jgi:hypothetical protein
MFGSAFEKDGKDGAIWTLIRGKKSQFGLNQLCFCLKNIE